MDTRKLSIEIVGLTPEPITGCLKLPKISDAAKQDFFHQAKTGMQSLAEETEKFVRQNDLLDSEVQIACLKEACAASVVSFYPGLNATSDEAKWVAFCLSIFFVYDDVLEKLIAQNVDSDVIEEVSRCISKRLCYDAPFVNSGNFPRAAQILTAVNTLRHLGQTWFPHYDRHIHTLKASVDEFIDSNGWQGMAKPKLHLYSAHSVRALRRYDCAMEYVVGNYRLVTGFQVPEDLKNSIPFSHLRSLFESYLGLHNDVMALRKDVRDDALNMVANMVKQQNISYEEAVDKACAKLDRILQDFILTRNILAKSFKRREDVVWWLEYLTNVIYGGAVHYPTLSLQRYPGCARTRLTDPDYNIELLNKDLEV